MPLQSELSRTRSARRLAFESRRAFTVLELLVSISVIGLLVGLLLPAVNSAREATRRIQCVDHLREVGLALHNHHDAKKSLPAGWKFDPSGETAFGWAVELLPYLGQPGLFDQIDCKLPVQHPNHDHARTTTLEVLLCPSDIVDPMFALHEESEEDEDEEDEHPVHVYELGTEPIELMRLPTANYVGVFGTLESDDSVPAPIGDGAFLENRLVRFRDFQRGLSHTFIVGERKMAQVPSTWFGVHLEGEDAAARIVGSALEGINQPLADECDFSSRHPGGANFLWGDGHVSFLTESLDLDEYHQWSKLR
ncbi:DUF1559 domain-containing protein [Rubripirellula amarantea]|nr:DUF1559 domain-containing protein [Rubripirellula amarantea]